MHWCCSCGFDVGCGDGVFILRLGRARIFFVGCEARVDGGVLESPGTPGFPNEFVSLCVCGWMVSVKA